MSTDNAAGTQTGPDGAEPGRLDAVAAAAELSGIPRRRILVAGAATAVGVVALASCGGNSTSGTASGGGGSSSSPATGTAAGAKPLATLADVPVGSAVSATAPDGKPMIVSQPEAGKVVGFSAICTHQGCTVKPAGDRLNCPCHGSVYDAATGKNLSGPAPRPLPPIAVHLSGGEVMPGT